MDISILIFSALISCLIALALGPVCIPLLRRLKFGQYVRDDGPKTHLQKSGTPTMGGVIIIIAFFCGYLRSLNFNIYFWIFITATIGFGVIGFLDDFLKITRKQSLGLRAKQKLFMQMFIAIFVCLLLYMADVPTTIDLLVIDHKIDLGIFYYLFVIGMLLAITNAVNFTDGLDGLLAGSSAISFFAYAYLSLSLSMFSVAVGAVSMIGALIGFLYFNRYPAKVFMGDAGSLAIGGALGICAILTKTELLFLLLGGLFVIEMTSVIIQVVWFKWKRTRIFRMSPIHHHFELGGWSEQKVVYVFWLIELVCASLGLLLYKGLGV